MGSESKLRTCEDLMRLGIAFSRVAAVGSIICRLFVLQGKTEGGFEKERASCAGCL